MSDDYWDKQESIKEMIMDTCIPKIPTYAELSNSLSVLKETHTSLQTKYDSLCEVIKKQGRISYERLGNINNDNK